ncbi:MAG TPA: hypothetical protein VK501_27245 [Baekduia sp.]|uniref:hypothetical protein n=1 Tax=Baekduia sp. TaxID=2600305 RepID=UPI002B6CCB94|nr:hypothetical protein [Baekduia sp.]HMJ37632.1 hypothetical protein [Baekduia sp.]
MRKFLIPAIGVLALVAVEVAPTIAQDSPQTTLTVTPTVSPNKAGTKKKPQGVKLNVKMHFETPGDLEKPIFQTGVVFFPKGSLYNGAKYPKCTEAKLNNGGLAACPKDSIMGKGTGDAFADTVITHPDITVVNGGGNKVLFWTILTNPARVQKTVVGNITKQTGKYAYKLTFTVPKALQIVAGVPISVRDLSVTAGGKAKAKDWLATTSCPANKKWPFSVTASLSTGATVEFADTVACK